MTDLLIDTDVALGVWHEGRPRDIDDGFAIVLVTHNLPLCFAVSDRIAVLNRGRKVADVPRCEADHNRVVAWITGAEQAIA